MSKLLDNVVESSLINGTVFEEDLLKNRENGNVDAGASGSSESSSQVHVGEAETKLAASESINLAWLFIQTMSPEELAKLEEKGKDNPKWKKAIEEAKEKGYIPGNCVERAVHTLDVSQEKPRTTDEAQKQ